MQVLILLILLLSDSFVFGLQPMFNYPLLVCPIWVAVSVCLMFLPYFRKARWMDESKWLGSGRDLWS